MKKIFSVLMMTLAFGQIQAREVKVASPDGHVVVTLNDEANVLVYNVALNGKTFVENSKLGFVTNLKDYSKDLSLAEGEKTREINENYSLRNIKKSHVEYKANELTCVVMQGNEKAFNLQFRVSNTDVAFRYQLLPVGENLCCNVLSEASEFRFPSTTTTFLCPQAEPMHGFAATSPSYETSYTLDDKMGKNGWGQGYTFPCLFHEANDGWVLVSETGVDSHYVASRLLGKADGTYQIGFPQAGEMNGQGSTSAAVMLPSYTPWRTITLGYGLKNIVETTVPFDLVEPLYEASQEYKYGKGMWSWIIQMDSYTTFDEQKRYIDFAAAMGYQSILVDALWDTQIGRDRIAELARYGASKGVALYLWYNSNGTWNHAPQGPRGIMDNTIARKKDMKWMKEIGVRGIKVDFFGGDKQPMIKLYEDILSDANDYGLLVIFHGCTLPRGWERMYPNYAASEAVLASENMHFTQGACDAEALNGCLHPFIRNTVGSMDFGGSTLNKHYSRDNVHGNTRRTSDVYALATAVLFQSPVQHFAMAPNNLEDAPKWALEFMKQVPTTWDEVKFVDGYPGKYVIIARRSGDKWYVAGINATDKPVIKKIALDMLSAGKTAQLYTDDAKLNGNVKTQRVGKTLKVTIPTNGAFVLVQ